MSLCVVALAFGCNIHRFLMIGEGEAHLALALGIMAASQLADLFLLVLDHWGCVSRALIALTFDNAGSVAIVVFVRLL